MPRTWILQGNPDLFNVDGYLQTSSDVVWMTPQHAAELQPDDQVFFWRASGKRRRPAGILARAVVAGRPREYPSVASEFSISDEIGAAATRVPLAEVVCLPPGHLLEREELRAEPELVDLAILRRPNSTVFPVTSIEARRLSAMWEQALLSAAAEIPDGAGEIDETVVKTMAAARDRAYRDPEFWARLDRVVQLRREALPEMRDLLIRFLDGTLDLVGFREEFDRRSRSKTWGAFGFGGMSGGMSLNKLVKYMPDQDVLQDALRSALRAPADAWSARVALDELHGLVQSVIGAGQASRAELQPARLLFLVSAFWHIQAPVSWPPTYYSVRERLADAGVTTAGTASERYLAFRATERSIRAHLGVPSWAFDQICQHDPKTPADSTAPRDPVPAREAEQPRAVRTWLVGSGRDDATWEWMRNRGIVAIGAPIGDLREYDSKEDMLEALRALPATSDNPFNDALSCWQFLREMAPGDEVFVKRGRSRLLAHGHITGPYTFEETDAVGRYEHRRTVSWSWHGDAEVDTKLVLKTLTEISSAPALEQLRAALPVSEPEPEELRTEPYTMDNALQDLFLDRSDLNTMLLRLNRKRNLVLQGPPGTGKTFVALRLARLLSNDRSDARVLRVQFHPSYGYEHFVEGLRPSDGGFKVEQGPFLKFCQLAHQDLENPYVVLIDEINRGHLGRIFGELMLLLEGDKRDPSWAVNLTYSPNPFWIPPNVYVIGTMNTADRSLALVDYALRRRFAFHDVRPAFTTTRFREFLAGHTGDASFADDVIARMKRLNNLLEKDPDLGSGFAAGHSWFCTDVGDAGAEAWYDDIVDGEILPLLREYWFDRPDAYEAAKDIVVRGSA